MKNIIAFALVAFALFLLYFVAVGQKISYQAQAEERFAKVDEFNRKAIATLKEDLQTNALLWQLALDLQDQPKDRKEVVRIIKSFQKEKLPEERGGFVQEISKTVDGVRIDRWKLAWARYSIVLTFDDQGLLSDINTDDLMMASALGDEVPAPNVDDFAAPEADEAEDEGVAPEGAPTGEGAPAK